MFLFFNKFSEEKYSFDIFVNIGIFLGHLWFVFLL